MKTWQMIKELTENPCKRFKNFDNEHLRAWVEFSTGSIKFENTSQMCKINPSTEWEWEEVKEPVTWQEAFEASINGKKITIEYENKTYEQESFLKIGCLSLGKTSSYGFDRKMLTEGTWYIED